MQVNSENDGSSDRPPRSLSPLEAMADAYKGYVSYLKEGGKSGISDWFGRMSIADLNQEAAMAQQQSPPVALSDAVTQKSPDNAERQSITIDQKMQAIFEILSGTASLQDITKQHSVNEDQVRKWLETAFQGMESALRADDSSGG